MSRLFFLLVLSVFPLLAGASEKIGVLVVAQDRGAVGNQELAAATADLDPDYPVRLLLIGADHQGIENGYAAYIKKARSFFHEHGVNKIIAIPLFISEDDYLLGLFHGKIEAAMAPANFTWTPALGESYLLREIVLDRIDSARKTSKVEQLVLWLSGASDTTSAANLQLLGERLLNDIRPHISSSKTAVAVTYSKTAAGPGAEAAETEAAAIVNRFAKIGQTLIIPLAIGPKFTPRMSLETSLARRYAHSGAHISESIMPHPAVRTWLQRMINTHVPVTEKTLGIIIMPHGSTMPYNDGIVAAMPSIVKRYPTAFAFGMASPFTMGQAVNELEAAGVRHGAFLRLYALPRHLHEASDYILGLRPMPPAHSHGGVPERVRTPIGFVTTGGYQTDPLISEILKDRILEVSQNPLQESVLLLSHGSRSDETNAADLALITEHNIAAIKATLPSPFRDIRAMSLREDWPDKRAKAVREIRAFIEQANKGEGRAIVISNRLYGSGPYATYLDGLEYVMNGQGLIPHPNFTRWVEKSLRKSIATLKAGAQGQATEVAAGHPRLSH
ncbi:hypothetical protein Noc_0857 [Nitrosococcus oceani ATCC 19707]|uniref:Cobalamin (Vitamin B12) biosynthesis CbiX protein n=2 Tax=Nitrosococcus oceani TaxID=1229 RepID=Q3JCS6_NITOC|nr:hypothetical protein [Nitrosococcus oceani]ABA57370.1 hypothetical protein Noc_0857 [Nitrosococcus oceani ATCC 19707]EDZ67764.1 hypothetical protein NOC27_1091 [Nitrosococcus oceani AFC27]KFI20347.1 hypothetical protein IB75_04325 [Nitrosococcus oceani C-27]GEM20246.1 hypothetical protein NONS58_16560 [Nitrosococcus oceani]